jgi:hypothetical protein
VHGGSTRAGPPAYADTGDLEALTTSPISAFVGETNARVARDRQVSGGTNAAQDRPMKSCIAAVGLLVASGLAIPTASADWVRGRLGAGVHLASTSLADGSGDEATDFGGGGLQIRYRLAPKWELELSLGGATAETPELDRELGVGTLGVLYHFNPSSRWVWSALGGFGGAGETVAIKSGGEVVTERELENGLLYLGGGIERRFGRISVAAELRLVAMSRDEDAADGPEFAGKDSPVPREMSGGQLRVMGTFYF